MNDYNEFRIRETERKAYNIGSATVLLEHIKMLMEKPTLSLDEAYNALGISIQKYKGAEEMLSE